MNCPRCAIPSLFFQLEFVAWDVTLAKKFAQGRPPSAALSPQYLARLGLPIVPDAANTRVVESHLPHIPHDKLREPILVAPLMLMGKLGYVVLDGNHRATRLGRQSEFVQAQLLTDRESLSSMYQLDRDTRRQWAIFPGIERLPNPKGGGSGQQVGPSHK